MKWNIKEAPLLKVVRYKNKLKISEIMARILINRDITIDTARREISEPLSLIVDPERITNAKAVAQGIADQCGKNAQFYVFADYDVDGLTSGYVMTDFLENVGEEVIPYFPERNEGYGLNMNFCQQVVAAAKPGQKIVVITVDNGIAALEPIQYLIDNGVEVIVTDHHKPQATLPPCLYCDPWTDRRSAGHHLAGVSVAWKICILLEDILGKGNAEKYLPYVAIGTISDVMPMTKENIALVNLGLSMINDCSVKTITTMLKYMGIKKINAEDIAWKIAPKLNACGRLGDIQAAAELFFMENSEEGEIKEQIQNIIEIDDQRKKLTDKATKKALSQDYSQDRICIFNASEYPHGIAGIIAGKLAEMNQKPAVVYIENDSDVYTASARSIPGLDLSILFKNEVDAGNAHSFGGHAQACGINLYADAINEFKESINQQINEMIINGNAVEVEPSIDIDAEITFDNFSKKLLNEIETIPYDKTTCPVPVFCMTNLAVVARQPYKNKDHLVLDCIDKTGRKCTLVSWGGYQDYEAIGCPKNLDIAGTLSTVGFPDTTCHRRADDITIKIKAMRSHA